MTYKYVYLYAPGASSAASPFDLEEYDRRNNVVDCWIRNEDMAYSLHAALRQAGYDTQRKDVERLCGVRYNHTTHGPYRDYYDQDTAGLVGEMEHLIVERHGYTF